MSFSNINEQEWSLTRKTTFQKRSITPFRNKDNQIARPKLQMNSEQSYDTPTTKENQIGKLNNKIYDRSIKTNPLATKSRSSSGSIKKKIQTEEYEKIQLFNPFPEIFENSIDENVFFKQNQLDNKSTLNCQVSKHIANTFLQQTGFNETARFGQKFNSYDEYQTYQKSPLKLSPQKIYSYPNNNTINTDILDSNRGGKRILQKYQIPIHQQNVKQIDQRSLNNDNQNQNKFQNNYPYGPSQYFYKSNENYQININDNSIPIQGRIKYSSTSPNSNRQKYNYEGQNPNLIEKKLKNLNQIQSEINKKEQNSYALNNKFISKHNSNKELRQNQNETLNLDERNGRAYKNDIQQISYLNNQKYSSSPQSHRPAKVNYKNTFTNTISNSDEQNFGKFQLNNSRYYINSYTKILIGDQVLQLQQKGTRACSPGGCRIKVLPIKNNGGIISEFQSITSREGSPNSIKMRKLKIIDSNDVNEQQSQQSQQTLKKLLATNDNSN